MKRWAAIERPNLIVPILLGFEVFSFGYFDLNTTPSRRSLNLPCQWWKNYPCFDRGTHKWPKVGGPHIVWSQDITPCDTSIWWIFEFLCLWHYLFLSYAVSYSSMLLLGIQEKNLTRRMPFNTSPCPNNQPIGMFHCASNAGLVSMKNYLIRHWHDRLIGAYILQHVMTKSLWLNCLD